jgi:hypothetical protein
MVLAAVLLLAALQHPQLQGWGGMVVIRTQAKVVIQLQLVCHLAAAASRILVVEVAAADGIHHHLVAVEAAVLAS